MTFSTPFLFHLSFLTTLLNTWSMILRHLHLSLPLTDILGANVIMTKISPLLMNVHN